MRQRHTAHFYDALVNISNANWEVLEVVKFDPVAIHRR
jgi:hypothetical protein